MTDSAPNHVASTVSDLPEITWPENSLLPVVVQDAITGEVLQVAYANAEALQRTLTDGKAWFYSRSRTQLWRKGETSGNEYNVREVRVDCDGDALLYLVNPTGPACHTGERSCFFRQLSDIGLIPATTPPASASDAAVLLQVWHTILERKATMPPGSYVRYLLTEGIDKIGKKVGEEAAEVIIAAKNGVPERTSSEIADLWFHTLVMLAACDMTPEEVFAQLHQRHH